MATPWRTFVVPAAVALVLAACGSDNGASTTTVAGTTGAPSTTVAGTTGAPSTAAPGQIASTAPGSSVPTPASTGDTAAPATAQIPGASDEIIVHVGVDDAATLGSRVEDVKRGDNVVLRLTSDSDEQYHVHGYDLEQTVAAGVEAQFEFTADMAGDFEVESHTTNKVYVVLHVS